MMTYAGIKKAIEEAKIDVRKQIATILVQADRPMMASEIGEIVGCSACTVAGIISSDDERNIGNHIPAYLRELGVTAPKVFRASCIKTETFVSAKNPTRTMTVKHIHLTYYIKK